MKRNLLSIILLTLSLFIVGCSNGEQEIDFVEEDVVIKTGNYELPGKLTMPITDEIVATVVFVHGSGPNNMNETIGALEPFKDLAIGLAKQGIASIRYDKRTYSYNKELMSDTDLTIYDEVIDDVISAINLLRTDSRVDVNNIFIIGHSFGGQLTPIILNLDGDLKGGILLAGTTENIIDLAMKQLEEQESPYYDAYLEYYDYFRNIKEVVAGEEGYFFMGAYEKYWASYNSINLEEETLQAASNYDMLIMQGGCDLQVPKETLDKYKELLDGKEKVVYRYYEDLNHCFTDGTKETISTAYLIKKNIPAQVIDDIVTFINNSRQK